MLKGCSRTLDVRTDNRKLGMNGVSARAWFDLIRISNVPVVLCGMLAGAFAATPSMEVGMWGLLIVTSILWCGAFEAFDDCENRDTNTRSVSFRSGRLSARSVLVGGHLFTLILALLSTMVEPLALLVILVVYTLIRSSSPLKRVSLFHHTMRPAALGLMPVYGSLMVAHEVRPLSVLVGASICLIDINTNIVGSVKALWNGAEGERVLPSVLGMRPAVSTALLAGVGGAFVQGAALPLGYCGSGILLPLGLGVVLTLQSRLALHHSPNVEVCHAALKSGRLTECLTLAAVLAGLLPWWESLAIIGGLTILAMCTRETAPGSKLPFEAAGTSMFSG